MTLGRQFQNTYWQNPDTGDVTDYAVRSDYRVDEKVNSERQTNQQGMLFSPYAHTGLVQDPTVSAEDRNQAIKKSLSLTDVDAYARRAGIKRPAAEGHIAGFVEAINKTDTTMSDIGRTHVVLKGELGRNRGHASFTGPDIVVGVTQGYKKVPVDTSGYEPSDVPIFNKQFWNQYDKHNPDAREYYPDVVAEFDTSGKRLHDEHSKQHIRWKSPDGTIYTNNDLQNMTFGDLKIPLNERNTKIVQRHEVKEGQPVTELDDDYKSRIIESRERAKTGGWNSYYEFDGVDINDLVRVHQSDDEQPSTHHLVNFLEENNIVPNVFPGKGKNTEKHSSKEVRLENGPDRRSINADYKHVTWHTRHEPDKEKPVKPPTRNVGYSDEQGKMQWRDEVITHKKVLDKNKYVPSTSTLVHEIGHTYEPQQARGGLRTERVRRRLANSITDPVAEGYADAHTDRTYYHRGQVEDVLHDVDARAKTISRSGYSSEYGNWNATERALYSAVRQHLATNPGDDLAIPNRQQLLEKHMTREDFTARSNHEQARRERDYSRRRNHRYGGHAPTNLDEDYDVHLANRLALGQMWEHLPELRPVLNKLGFGRTASEAHRDYMSRTASNKPLTDSAVRARTKKTPDAAEQLSLIEPKTRRKRS